MPEGGSSDDEASEQSLALIDGGAVQPWLPDLTTDDQSRVDEFITRASASATLRAYRSDWRLFCAWCETRGYQTLPASPQVTAAFLTELATCSGSQ